MPTVRELAHQAAARNVTRERFHEILAGFGIDSYSADPNALIEEQVASVPTEEEEFVTEQAPTFDMPAAYGIQQPPPPAPPTPPPVNVLGVPMERRAVAPLAPLAEPGGRPVPLPVERPEIDTTSVAAPPPWGEPPSAVFREEADLGEALQKFAYDKPYSALPVAEAIAERPSVRAAPRTIAEMASYAARGSGAFEAPEVLEAQELAAELAPEEASVMSHLTPKALKGRAHAAYVRVGDLIGTASGKVAKQVLKSAATRDPAAWESDEEEAIELIPGVVSMRLSAGDRRLYDRQWERDEEDHITRESAVVKDALRRSGQHTAARLAADSALDLGLAVLEFIDFTTGGDIPKEYWEEAPVHEREALTARLLGFGVDPREAEFRAEQEYKLRPQSILQEDAQEKWVSMGSDMVALLTALRKHPEEVSKTHSIMLLAIAAPLIGPMTKLGRAGIIRPIAPKALKAAGWGGELVEAYMPRFADGARRFADIAHERAAGFKRFYVDPMKMPRGEEAAGAAAQRLMTEGVEQAGRTEQGMRNLGQQLAREHRGPRAREGAALDLGRFEEGRGFSLREAGAEAAAEAAVEPQGFQLGHVDPATGRFIPSREPARTPGDVAFERAELRARKQEAARVELEQPRAPTLDPETGTFIPTRQPLGLPSPETVTPSPLPGSLTHKQLAGLTRFLEKNPALEGQVVAMLREGGSAADIVARLKRAYDPAHTRPVALETVSEPLGAADMPAFEDVALPEGFTRADVGLPPREFAAPGVEGGRRATAAPEVLPEVAEARAAMEAKRAKGAESQEWGQRESRRLDEFDRIAEEIDAREARIRENLAPAEQQRALRRLDAERAEAERGFAADLVEIYKERPVRSIEEWESLHDSAMHRIFDKDAELLAGHEILTRTPAERGLDPFTEPPPSTTPWERAGADWVHDVAKEVLGPGWKDVARELGSTEALLEHITPLREAATWSLRDAHTAAQRPIWAEIEALDAQRGALTRLPSELRREPIPRDRSLVVRDAQQPIDVATEPGAPFGTEPTWWSGEAVPRGEPLRLEYNPRAYAERPVDPARMGYTFTRERYFLNERGTLERLPIEADVVRELQPKPRSRSREANRLIDEAVEIWGDEGVLTPGATNKGQLAAAYEAAVDARLPNARSIATVREATLARATKDLVELTATPDLAKAYRTQVRRLIDDVEVGSIRDISIEYIDPAGRRQTYNVTDQAMRPAIEADPGFQRIVKSELIDANFQREATRARQSATQNTWGDALQEWHPTAETRAQALNEPPSVKVEFDYLVDRFNRTGELPPLTRNVAQALVDEGMGRLPPKPKGVVSNALTDWHRAKRKIFPPRLERSLRRMGDAEPWFLDVTRIADTLEAGPRDVRLPALGLKSLAADGVSLGPPRLSVPKSLQDMTRWQAVDRGWMKEMPNAMTSSRLKHSLEWMARMVKTFKVPANSSSWMGAVVGNTMTGAMKLADPLFLPKSTFAILDFYRFKGGMPTHYPKEWYEAVLRTPALDSGFVKSDLHRRLAPELMPQKGEGLSQWIERVRETEGGKRLDAAGEIAMKGSGLEAALKTFDHFDNGPKLYETMFNMGRRLDEWNMLRDGQYMDFRLSGTKKVHAIYRESSIPGKTHMEVNGKRLTKAQELAIVARASAEPALKTYVDFSEPPMVQVYKRNLPLWDMIGSPFSGWRAGTTTIPFFRRGIVGEILGGPTPRGATNSHRVMAMRARGHAAHSIKIGAMLTSQDAALDPDSGALRKLSGFSIFADELRQFEPTEAPGVYNVWDISNSNSFEDLGWWLRLYESGTHLAPEMFGYIDPAEALHEGGREVGLMSEDEIRRLSKEDQDLVRAAQRHHMDKAQGAGLGWKDAFASAYVAGSAVADAFMQMSGRSDIEELGAGHYQSPLARSVISHMSPGLHRRIFTGAAEHRAKVQIEYAEERRIEADELRKEGKDADAADLESQAESAEKWADWLRYMAKADRGQVTIEVGDPYPLEDTAYGLLDTVLQSVFKSPRTMLLFSGEGKGGVSQKAISKYKKAWKGAFDARLKNKSRTTIDRINELSAKIRDSPNPTDPGLSEEERVSREERREELRKRQRVQRVLLKRYGTVIDKLGREANERLDGLIGGVMSRARMNQRLERKVRKGFKKEDIRAFGVTRSPAEVQATGGQFP